MFLVPVLHIKSLLFRDRVPTYLVSEWDAVCTMWDGDAISGPVPTLYATWSWPRRPLWQTRLKLIRYTSYVKN
jgi:hypothetical protein